MMFELNGYSLFLKISRWWLYLLIVVNFIGLTFFSVDKDADNWSYLYTSIVANIVVSYLVIAFMFLNHDGLNYPDVSESVEPFHEWVWFYCPSLERWCVILCFSGWMIPNIMHLFYLSGWLSWIIGLFCIVSLIWWGFVVSWMIVSAIRSDQSLLLPR